MKSIKIITFSLVTVFIVGCTSTKESTANKRETVKLKEIFTQEVEADFNDLRLWVNMMPNSGTKLHVAGIVTVSENFKYDINFITLRDIIISQNDKLLYQVSPVVQLDPNLSTETKKTFRFSTTSGLSLTPEVELDNVCMMEFHFYDGTVRYKYILENVLIEKIY